MTNFENLKQLPVEDFAKFIMDGTEHNDFFVFNNGIDGDWYTYPDFIKWLNSECSQ